MAEGYVYELRNGGVACSTASTILQIKAGSCALEILRASIGQRGSTATDPAALAAGGTSATGITASAEGTDGDVLIDENFNIVNGTWTWLPTPEERIRVGAGGIIGLKFLTAPGSQTWYASVKWRELA